MSLLDLDLDRFDEDAWRWRERILGRFEDHWQSGSRPEIDQYLPVDDAGRRHVLVELVHVDLEYRLKTGDGARVEDYLGRYPELASDADVVLDLIAVERELRRRREPGLMLEEYLRRFPSHRTQLLGGPSCGSASGDRRVRLVDQAHAEVSTLTLRRLAHGLPRAGRPLPEGAPPGRGSGPIATIPGGDPPPGAAAWVAPVISGYEIVGELGQGGMGVVYLARQLKLKRLVALKMILPGTKVRAATLERFRIEAEAVARLQHPNIVQIYEVDERGGRPFICLEYVPGGSLAQKLGGTPQAPEAAARVVQALAWAVHAAHEQGVVHRDLKPSNVLLMGDGTPKITDFGLAKQLDMEEGVSLSGEIKGTPSYMAPEQAAGKTLEIGPLADVYALGAILYEMLTGRPPFKAATALETVAQVLEQEPVPPGRLHPKLPRDLETICLKCLEKDPRRRYVSAAALARDLARFLACEPIAARRGRPWARGVKWARRRPAAAGLVAVSAVAVLSVFACVVSLQRQRALIAERELGRIHEKRLRAKELRADMLLRLEGPGTDREQLRRVAGILDTYLETGISEADIHRERGLVRAKLGDHRGALADFTRVLEAERDPAAHVIRGWIYLLVFDAPRLALPDFEEAIQFDANNGDAYNGRGLARLMLGQVPGDAVADAERAIRLGPKEPRLFYNAARTYAQAVGRLGTGDCHPEGQVSYQDRAVQLLREGIGLIPAEGRGRFWEMIESDPAWTPIRRSPGFLGLRTGHPGATGGTGLPTQGGE
jgi:hypothetical protein